MGRLDSRFRGNDGAWGTARALKLEALAEIEAADILVGDERFGEPAKSTWPS